MAPQSGFDYTPKRHAETLKRLQGGLGMNDIEMQELRATIMSEMEKQGLKYCNMKDATTKSKAERVSAVAKVHLAARLGGIPTEWIDHTLWCIIKNLNADTKRRADAGAEIQTGDAKRRKKNKIESTTQSDSKDIPNSESLQGQTNSMDAIIQHPRLGTILSLANQQGVAKYISLHEIIGPDNQPSQALFPDILDRASFDVFRQTPGVRSLLVDETTHALYCWLPLHQNWIPVEDAATFRALLKQQAVGRESMVFFGIQPRPVPVEVPQAAPSPLPEDPPDPNAHAPPQDESLLGSFGNMGDMEFELGDGDAQPRSLQDIIKSNKGGKKRDVDVATTTHSVSRMSMSKEPLLKDDQATSSQPQLSTLSQTQLPVDSAAANPSEGLVNPEKPTSPENEGGPPIEYISSDEDEEDIYSEIDFDVDDDDPNHIIAKDDEVDGFNAWAKAARDTKAIEHFSEENMAELARFFLMKVDDLKYKLRRNRKEGESEYVLSKKTLKGLKKEPYCYQLYGAFKAMKLRNSASKGAILAEEMGLGKTLETIIVLWIQRLKNLNAVAISRYRDTGQGPEHLPKDNEDPDVKCPSQAHLPILCGCVKNSPTATFEVQYGINLILVPGKLVKNWVNEWREAWDPVYWKVLKFTLWVGHREPSLREYVPSYKQVEHYWVNSKTEVPTVDAQCLVFITTPDSFDNHVMKKFTEIERKEVEVPNRKRLQVVKHEHNRLFVGFIAVDEYHERKGAGTGLIKLLLGVKEVNPKANILALSGTPWNRTPGDLTGILTTMAKGSEMVWQADPRLRFGMKDGMKRIVSAFESSTRGAGTVTITDELKARIDELANLQEATTIGRRSESLWFGVPIVQLPKKHVYKPNLDFPKQLLGGLKARESTLRTTVNQSSNAKTSTGQKNMLYFTKAWQLRAIATIPGLVDLLAKRDELNVTWKQFHHEKKWLDDSKNPYYRQIKFFQSNGPKLLFCMRQAEKLSTMRWKGDKDKEVTGVYEKLVIVGHNPVVCAIVAKMLKRRFWDIETGWAECRKVKFVHGGMSFSERQDIVDAFQQKEESNAALECDIIVGPVNILGTGVNLTRARKIIILDIEWLATATLQSMFRIHRLGQLNETFVWILRCSAVEIDRKMHDVQEKRGALLDMSSRTEEEAKGTRQEEQEKDEEEMEEAEVGI